MEKKTISNFQEFECNVTELDKIKGGKALDERICSGTGIGMGEKTVKEYINIFDDGTFSHEYFYTN